MSSAGSPMRVGIVGCGSFGRHAYALNVVDHPDVRLTALCDVDPSRTEALVREVFDEQNRKPRPSVFIDYREMIDKTELDVVMVATLADVRPAVTVAALRAGAHVLAAKPMAPSLEEAEEMLRAAEEADRMLMVGYNFRFRVTRGQRAHVGSALYQRAFGRRVAGQHGRSRHRPGCLVPGLP